VNAPEAILRLEMDRQWSCSDLGQMILAVNDLYNLRLILEAQNRYFSEVDHLIPGIRRPDPGGRQDRTTLPPDISAVAAQIGWPITSILSSEGLAHITTSAFPDRLLSLHRIRYSSPGVTDISGIAGIVGYLKDFLVFLIEWFGDRRKRQLECDRADAEIVALRIQNVGRFISLAEKCGYGPQDVRQLIRFVDGKQDTLLDLVQQSKLREAVILERNPNPDADAEADQGSAIAS